MSILSKFSLAGQVAVVTGASQGIGRGIALALADAGADVVVAARGAQRLETLVREIEGLGVRGLAFAGDVATQEACERLAGAAVKTFGKLDIWVNNIGGLPGNEQRMFMDVDEENFDGLIDLNLKSFWAGVRAAVNHMPNGGSIISLSSRSALMGIRTKHGIYAATKAAINSMTVTLAGELGPKIRVNAVAPGPIPTESFYTYMKMDEKILEERAPGFQGPLGRLGTPEDIGAAVVFLASPAASYITGHCLYVTGGAY